MSIINKLIIAFGLAFLATPAFPQSKTLYSDWELVKIIDGDTVKFKVKFLPKELGNTLSIRVNGVDTPEKGFRGQCEKEKKLGEEASAFTKSLFVPGKKIQISLDSWDKYGGRVLGEIYIDGYPLSKMLIEKGYAREYHGEKKQSWCN